MRKVQHVQNAEDEREAKREQRVNASYGQSIEYLLREHEFTS